MSTPKPLLEIAPGLRFIDVLIEEAARQGFHDILLLAGHKGDQVETLYQGKRVRQATVRVMIEPEPMGTGGALHFASEELQPHFLMANGDSLFEINLRALAVDLPAGVEARLALREVPDPSRYGAVELEGDRITGFMEKRADLAGPALINGGLYVMSRSVLERIDGPCSVERDVFPHLAAAGRLQGLRFDDYFIDMGLPDTFAQAQREVPARRRRPCAFLDRDGVLNVDEGYTHRPEDLAFVPGAESAVRTLNEAGYYVIVVSNQAGVARGVYAEEQVHEFHAAMSAKLAEAGAHIDDFYFCPFHEDGVVERYRVADHPDRKPNPGMIVRAMSDWPIDRERSFLIGDKESDVAAAGAAGVTGHLFCAGALSDLVEKAMK